MQHNTPPWHNGKYILIRLFSTPTIEPITFYRVILRMWDGTTWIDLATTVDTVANTATAKVSHFTIFVLFAASPVAPPPTPTPSRVPPTIIVVIIGGVPYHSMETDFTIKGSLKIDKGVREALQ